MIRPILKFLLLALITLVVLILLFATSSCKLNGRFMEPLPPDDAFLDSPWFKNNQYKVWAEEKYWVFPDSNYLNEDLDKNKTK